MILTIDVGNTSTGFAQFEGEKITKRWTVETKKIGKFKFPPSKKFSKVVVSSVVPSVDKIIKRYYKKSFFVEAQKIKGLKIKIKRASEVGADRAVNAFYAINKYHKPCVVIDFGTATTFDVISKKGEYLGGAISAGIKMTLYVLF